MLAMVPVRELRACAPDFTKTLAGDPRPADIAEWRVSAQNGHPTLSQRVIETPRSRIWH
jgi:hypothetical protein